MCQVLLGSPDYTFLFSTPHDASSSAFRCCPFSAAVNEATQTGCEDFNKIELLNSLPGIRNQTFKETSISSAFQESGIIPLCPQVVLEKLKRHEPSDAMVQHENDVRLPQTPLPLATPTRPSTPDRPSTPATPMTVRSLKRQGEDLLSCNMDPTFHKKLVTYLKGSQG
jgi:hypothetical protein